MANGVLAPFLTLGDHGGIRSPNFGDQAFKTGWLRKGEVMLERFGLCVLVALVLTFAGAAVGQESGNNMEELSKQAANPLADLISLPFQNNTNFGLGPFDRTANVLNIQPVIPFADGRIITRTIAPILWIPDVTAESGRLSTGLGDILFTAFYTPPSTGLIWGLGAALEMPTGGSKRGSQKWALGPSIVALAQPGEWTLGVLANNVWSFAGESEREDVNKGLVNLFLVRQLGGGWYINSVPIITVNWKADSGQRWIVPVGAGFGKVAMLGKLPVNTQVGAYANVVKPDAGPDWQLRVQVQFFLPKPGGSKS
jgi:hypothetical protein